MFADLGGGAEPRAPRPVKPVQALVQAAAAPFNMAGMAFALMGDSELAEIMPLSPDEEKRVADALYTVTKNNPALTAALERSGPGLSMLHLGVTLVAVLAPRINTARAVIAQRREVNRIDEIFDSGHAEPGTPVPAGTGSGTAPLADARATGPADAGNGGPHAETGAPYGWNAAGLRAHSAGAG